MLYDKEIRKCLSEKMTFELKSEEGIEKAEGRGRGSIPRQKE